MKSCNHPPLNGVAYINIYDDPIAATTVGFGLYYLNFGSLLNHAVISL